MAQDDTTSPGEDAAAMADGCGEDDSDDPPAFEPVEREPHLAFWHREFGVDPAVFDGFALYALGASKIWIVDDAVERTVEDASTRSTATVSVQGPPARETVGMPFLRVNTEHWKPTTDALQRFGDHISKNVVDLDAEQARAFVAGDTVEEEYPDLASLGYVAVRYRGDVLGCGLYFPGELRSQVPKGRRVELVLPG